MAALKLTSWKLLVPLAIVLVVLAYFFLRKPAVELPQKLGGLTLVNLLDGEKANQILDRMHDKEVTPATNLIGMYTAGGANAVLYLSVYRSNGDAKEAYGKMARSIDKGNLLFSNYRSVRVGSVDASYCFGQGQDHYFFVYDDRLYWLAADGDISKETAQELVDGL